MKSIRELRTGLERRVGTLNERAWNYLVSDRYVGAVIEGDYDLSWLVSKYRELLDIGKPLIAPVPAPKMLALADSASSAPRSTTELRLATLSRLVALEAAKDPGVVALRSEVLDGTLIDAMAVEEWIRQQALADGPETLILSDMPVPSTSQVLMTPEGYAIDPPLSLVSAASASSAYVYYALPGDQTVRMWNVSMGGALDRLRRVTERLAQWYGWGAGQATLFVLTGGVPALEAATAPLQYRRFPALSRLELTVDLTLTPVEVADFYRRARKNALSRRYRALSEKHLQLAAFSVRTNGESAREGMRTWNAEFPRWAYINPGNFRRDCRQAQQRLLYPPLAWDPFGQILSGERADTDSGEDD